MDKLDNKELESIFGGVNVFNKISVQTIATLKSDAGLNNSPEFSSVDWEQFAKALENISQKYGVGLSVNLIDGNRMELVNSVKKYTITMSASDMYSKLMNYNDPSCDMQVKGY